METFQIAIIALLGIALIAFFFRLRALYKTRTALTNELNLKISEIQRAEAEIERLQKPPEQVISETTQELSEELHAQGKIDLNLKKALKRAEEANFLRMPSSQTSAMRSVHL